jgi:ATP-dependent exoDNAse (exonuclease V) alpha subunit
MSKTIELTGKYLGERFRFDNSDGTAVIIGSVLLCNGSKDLVTQEDIDADGPIAIKGEAEQGELTQGQTYRFLGTWTSYLNKRSQQREKQFAFRTFVPYLPKDRQGVIDYLTIAGRGNGIGPSKARQLVETIGVEEVLSFCKNEPDKVAYLVRISDEQAETFSEKLKKQAATENATLEVDQLLQGHGLPRTLTRRVIKKFGNLASEQITEDPYSLMQFRGVGFKLTDKLYIGLGKDPKSIDRQALCLWYGMASNNDGHTWFPAGECVTSLQRMVGSQVDYLAAIRRGIEYGQISDDHYGAIASQWTDEEGNICERGHSLWLAEGKYAAAEQYVAKALAKKLHESTTLRLTRYANVEHVEKVVLDHATCQRCGRQLTASTVHVVDGKPYGPTCANSVGSESVEVFELNEWLQKNPAVYRYVQQLPAGIITLPEVTLWPDASELLGCSDHQREQAARSMSGRVGILGGSPGTGKTFTLAEIIRAVQRSGRVGYHEIGIGAPTGKAAVRLTEALQAAGVPIRARTTHSLLGVGEADSETGSWQFKHNERNPWSYKMLFLDEQSMTDIGMCASILKAVPPGCHVLFVGDVNQLAPVGNGAPFRDMILASLPYGELKEIKRNSGGIVEACARIRDEQDWTELAGGNLLITGDSTDRKQIDRLFRELDSVPAGIDPVWDCQVLVAVNKSSALSRAKLNEQLQERLNPNSEVKGTPFRVADKVVCLKNGFFKSLLEVQTNEEMTANEAGEVYVANGELGIVDAIEDKHLVVKLDNPTRLVMVPRGKAARDDSDESESTGCSWDLGYALSVHKYQGSEQKYVFGMLDTYPGARMVCDRSWIYTLISRAKDRCVLIGTADTAERFCRTQKVNQRRTFLAKFIQREMFLRQVGAIL